MSHLGASGPGDAAPESCPADGRLEPGRSVVEAVECGSARFLTLTHADGGVEPTYLVLTASESASSTPLSTTDAASMPEIQNAIAYFGPDVESVRVQMRSDRRAALQEHVSSLRRSATDVFEFAGRQFELDVVLG